MKLGPLTIYESGNVGIGMPTEPPKVAPPPPPPKAGKQVEETFYCGYCFVNRVPTKLGNCPGCGLSIKDN